MSTPEKRKFRDLGNEIEAFLGEMRRCNYSDVTVEHYRYHFRALKTCAAKHEIDFIGDHLVRIFLIENGMDPDAGAVDLSTRRKWRRRVAMTLHHFVQHGEIPLQLSRRATYPGAWERTFAEFGRFCKIELELSDATIRSRNSFLHDFIPFVTSYGILTPRDLTTEIIKKYCTDRLLRPSIWSRSVASRMAVSGRSFMKYLLRKENGNPDWGSIMPKIKHARVSTLPYIWSVDDIRKLLSAVDRGSPVGKRDFAMLMLASSTGMRNGDIRTLQIDDIHWEDSCIRFTQNKTKNEQVLPLPEDAGASLIDYLRNGRPSTTWREIFVRHRPPFAPLSAICSRKIVQRYCRQVGIRPPSRRGIGLHAFRHTIASRLMEADVEFETISGILGHASLDTTKQYTRVDIDALRKAALDSEEESHD